MKPHFSKLDNGLRVIIAPVAGVESATTLILVGTGSRFERRENSGISHFLEHMAFKGTKKRPTAREIAGLVDSIGAESNAFTGKELTGFYIKSSANHVGLALDLLSDIVVNSKFDQEEIDREKNVIIEEINLYEDTPARKVGDVFENLLYGDTPMGWDIAGSKEIVKGLRRDDFVSYLDSLYSADNMVLVVSGKIDVAKTLEDTKKYFSSLAKFKIKTPPGVLENQKEAAVVIKHKKTEQAHFVLGVRTVGLIDKSDRYPLSVLSSILGGGMSSRLFHEIRERRGLAYYVRTISDNYTDLGYLATYAGVDPKRIEEAVKVVVDEYEKIKNKNEIKLGELKKAKEYLKGHFVLELEDTRSVASFYGASELLEKEIESPKEVIKQIEDVKLADVLRVAKTYLQKQRLNLAIIGDFKEKEHFLKLLE